MSMIRWIKIWQLCFRVFLKVKNISFRSFLELLIGEAVESCKEIKQLVECYWHVVTRRRSLRDSAKPTVRLCFQVTIRTKEKLWESLLLKVSELVHSLMKTVSQLVENKVLQAILHHRSLRIKSKIRVQLANRTTKNLAIFKFGRVKRARPWLTNNNLFLQLLQLLKRALLKKSSTQIHRLYWMKLQKWRQTCMIKTTSKYQMCWKRMTIKVNGQAAINSSLKI